MNFSIEQNKLTTVPPNEAEDKVSSERLKSIFFNRKDTAGATDLFDAAHHLLRCPQFYTFPQPPAARAKSFPQLAGMSPFPTTMRVLQTIVFTESRPHVDCTAHIKIELTLTLSSLGFPVEASSGPL